jgi:hypothetical protein
MDSGGRLDTLRAMKTPAALFRLLTSRRAGFLSQWLLLGMLGGVVCALLLLHRQPPQYEAKAQVRLEYPGIATAGAAAKHEWLKSQAAEMLSEKSLTQAALVTGMDSRLGLSAEECARRLVDAVDIRVAPDDLRWVSDRSNLPPGEDVLYISVTSPDAHESARLLKSLLDQRSAHLGRLTQARRADDPAHAQWLALSSKLPALSQTIGESERELRSVLDSINARPVRLTREQLIAATPPALGAQSHRNLKKAVEELDAIRAAMDGLRTTGGYSLQILSQSGVPVDPVSTNWATYLWKRALVGGGAALVLAALWLLIRSRNFNTQPVVPRPEPLAEY